MSKYDLDGDQTHFQPGSDDRVLANKLGITDPEEMDDAELHLLEQLYERVVMEQLPTGAIDTKLIKGWHRQWLLPIYAWAGEERSVNLAKDGFQFAAAQQIPVLLKTLDRDFLAKRTPCANLDGEALIEAIATVHVEFILVHPFREGNGRISRLLADVMAVQAGYGTLDYSSWDANKLAYISAIHSGLECDYEPMMEWVGKALSAS